MVRGNDKSELVQPNEEVMRWEDVSDVVPKMSFPSTWKGRAGMWRREEEKSWLLEAPGSVVCG